jgi:hypothetical protein
MLLAFAYGLWIITLFFYLSYLHRHIAVGMPPCGRATSCGQRDYESKTTITIIHGNLACLFSI